jgi:hypothetical protein
MSTGSSSARAGREGGVAYGKQAADANDQGAYEMLAGEAIEFAKLAKDAGVDITRVEGQYSLILGPAV